MQSREIRLASRPTGLPSAANFSLATTDVPPLSDGQVLVRNLFMSVDPYMRGRMNAAKSYVAPFAVDQPLEGGAVGEVVESRAPAIAAGSFVISNKGWRDRFVAEPHELRVVDGSVQPLSVYLGALGMTGFTAWIGLDLVGVKAGEVIFISGAAGAVGSLAGQLAKLRGCHVIGSAGSADKVRLLTTELGFDTAFNYKDGLPTVASAKVGDVHAQLKRAAPGGIDVYFDNVGGDHLEAAFSSLRDHGRVAACGQISRYNADGPTPGPRNMFVIVTKRLTIRGFLVFDWMKRMPEFLAEVAPQVANGRIRSKETIVEGLERAPQAFMNLFSGENVGKMVVKI
jgi:NADPH-dependent curcumin reductase CurA